MVFSSTPSIHCVWSLQTHRSKRHCDDDADRSDAQVLGLLFLRSFGGDRVCGGCDISTLAPAALCRFPNYVIRAASS